MPRTRTAFLIAIMGVAIGLGPALTGTATAAERTITLSPPASAMANVPATFTVRVTPRVNALAQIQVATTNGWARVKQGALNDRGIATVSLTSSQAVKRSYRAAIVSRTTGKVLGYSSRVDVTWAALTHAVSLACDQSSAPIRVRVPCTISVTPVVRLSGLAVELQVMGREDWIPMFRRSVPTDTGKISATVEGLEPGLGRYRVLLFRLGTQIAVSNTVSISWSSPTEPQ